MATNDTVINIKANPDSFNKTLGEVRREYEQAMKALEGDSSEAAEDIRKSLQKAFNKQVQDSFKNQFKANAKEMQEDAEKVGEQISGWFKADAIASGFMAIKGGLETAFSIAQSVSNKFGELVDRGAELARSGEVMARAFGDAFDPERADDFINRMRSNSGVDRGRIQQELANLGNSGYSQGEAEKLLRLSLDAAIATEKGTEEVAKAIREISHGDLGPMKDFIGYELESTGNKVLDAQRAIEMLDDKFGGVAEATMAGNVTFESMLTWVKDEFGAKLFKELKDDMVKWREDVGKYLSSDEFKGHVSSLVDLTKSILDLLGPTLNALSGVVNAGGAVGEVAYEALSGTGRIAAAPWNIAKDIGNIFRGDVSFSNIRDLTGIESDLLARQSEQNAISRRRAAAAADSAWQANPLNIMGKVPGLIDDALSSARERYAPIKAQQDEQNKALGEKLTTGLKEGFAAFMQMRKLYADEVEKERNRREREQERYADQLERERERALRLAVQQPIQLNVFGNTTNRLNYARGF